jgi:outer membrane protein assembly factor BamA
VFGVEQPFSFAWWVGIVALVLLGTGCVHVKPRENRTPMVIWKVDFKFYSPKGKELKKSILSASTISSAMATAETSGTLAVTRLWLAGKFKIYKRKTVLADVERIRKLYRYNGFYEPQVDFDESRDLKLLAGANKYRPYHRVQVTIRIVEGPRIKVSKVKYMWPKEYVWLPPNKPGKREAGISVGVRGWHVGKEPHDSLKGVLSDPMIKVGSPFSTPQYKLWKAILLKRLQDRSFAMANVRGRVIIDKLKQTAEIELWLVPLISCQFGSIEIVNNKHVGKDLIQKLIKFKANSGKYNVQKLVNTQRALFALGLFRTVNVKPDLECAKARLVVKLGGKLSPKQMQASKACLAKWDQQNQKNNLLSIPIVVDTQEDKFQLIKFGVGIGFDGQRQQAGVSFNWNFKHFLGGLRELQLQFNPSIAVLPDIIRRFDIGPEIVGSITFKQPIFMDQQAELGLRFLGRRAEQIGDSDFTTLTPSIWFSRPLWGRLTGRISFNVEFALGVQNPLSLERENYLLSYFEQQLVLDLRNDPLNTTKGIFFSLTLQQAPFGTFQYIKITPEFRFFVPMPMGMTFAGRMMYGIMWSQRTGQAACPGGGSCVRSVGEVLRQSPLTQRFFSGGANSVRGWTARYLGPLACRIQKRVYQEVTANQNVQPSGQSGSVSGVRIVRQIQQKSESVPDPVDPQSAQKSERQRQLHPLLKRGVTCRPASVQVQQARASDLADRRNGLPLDDRAGTTPLAQQQTLQVVPTGGHHLLEGSLELRVPLAFVSKNLGIVVFVDAGVVQLEPQFEVLDELIPTVSVGGGFRFRTPVGALRLDIAGRISPDDDRYPLQPHWQIHFSFGEAF